MRWLVALRSLLPRWVAALLLCATAGLATAQNLESVLRPGDLIQGHAKHEEDCKQCHVKFDRAAQDRLCMDCHKEVGQDVRARTGFHGKQKPQACRSCHTDHKGRDARIAPLDEKRFDHAQTDYALHGKHTAVACGKCHVAPHKYRESPQDCLSCHRADDVHKGALGAKCVDCHADTGWKDAKFDHDRGRFPLTGKHVDTRCADCHKDKRYQDTPRACVACHRKDDDSARGHKGRFGERCESCHTTKAWTPSSFSHDADTKFALRGKHRAAKCNDCHTAPLFRERTPTQCVDCHRKDDRHEGSLGRDCASCHTERDWKETGSRFDHDKSRFPLLGRHKDTGCKDCHKTPNFKDAPSDCLSCHRKNDKHDGTLGPACADCHVERDWKSTPKFDHERSKFPLRNAHAAQTVRCAACHVDLKHLRGVPTDCVSCHRKDDKHEGQQGPRCEQCHDDRSWKSARFDHRLTRFPLLGRHVVVKCTDCHATPRYKDAAKDCIGCHRKDDRHQAKYGTACESCHNARSWGIWDFDHDRRSTFALDGAHRKVACTACHVKPAPAGLKIAALGADCISCHRRDDTHDGAFGSNCEQCHYADRWKHVKPKLRSGIDPGPAAPRPWWAALPPQQVAIQQSQGARR